MKMLHLGCGAVRPSSSNWVNIDTLYSVFPDEKCPERVNLSKEKNYLDHDLCSPLPFPEDSVDGIVANHVIEHFDAIDCLAFFKECHRVLKKNGVLRVGVPDPTVFISKTESGDNDWGEGDGIPCSFMEFALFYNNPPHDRHRQVIGLDTLKCYFWTSGFAKYERKRIGESWLNGLSDVDNRPIFTLFMEGIK